jgi:hypothetical protein
MTDVIMPALGMAQDTGKLVQWLKQPGDAVSIGDQLFEVETDKSVMEVEAQESGFLTQVSAADGEDVPVGQVIARITATAENATAEPKVAVAPAVAPTVEPEVFAEPVPEPAPVQPARVMAVAATSNDRLLASPKARRLAAQEGLDLRQLAATGRPMPYHVSDLETLRSLPAAPSGQAVVMAASKQITARTSREGAREFMDWMKEDGAINVTSSAMFASFAASAWRVTTESGTVIVHLSAPEGEDIYLRNPDFTRLSAPPQETDETPSFVLHDLSDSFLTSLRLGDIALPTVSIGADSDSYLITFEFGADHMEDDHAIAFITGLAQRLSEPLRHLV